MKVNEREGVVYKQPTTAEERSKVATDCRAALKLSMPMLLDSLDNAADRAYAALPDRLYVIDKDGRVAYKGRPGPGGFRPAEMERALAELLAP